MTEPSQKYSLSGPLSGKCLFCPVHILIGFDGNQNAKNRKNIYKIVSTETIWTETLQYYFLCLPTSIWCHGRQFLQISTIFVPWSFKYHIPEYLLLSVSSWASNWLHQNKKVCCYVKCWYKAVWQYMYHKIHTCILKPPLALSKIVFDSARWCVVWGTHGLENEDVNKHILANEVSTRGLLLTLFDHYNRIHWMKLKIVVAHDTCM